VPFVQSIFANTLQPGMLPTGAFQQFSNQSTSGLATYVEFNPKRDYVMQWNLGVARELTSTLSFTLAMSVPAEFTFPIAWTTLTWFFLR
jgi:hypothetical protein